MIKSILAGTVAIFATASLIAGSAVAQGGGRNLQAILEGAEIPVTVDNFVYAATDFEFRKYLALAGGVNQFVHFRAPTPVDMQTTVRMNRDTVYSMAIVNISEGATLSLPEMGDRYVSAQIVNQHHFMNEVFSGGGDHSMTMDTFETPFVFVGVRTLVDGSDPDDLAAVAALQDQMSITAGSDTPFVPTNFDEESFEAVLQAAKELGRFVPDSNRTFGPRGVVDPIRYFLGAATGWGGLPEAEAYYLNVEPGLPVAEYKIEVPAEVPTEAFWSISLYNADGFFEENTLGAYNFNSVSGEPNDDGSMTVHFGGCDDGRVNCLPIMDGWMYTVRLYQPGPEILDGSWTFPDVEPAN
jgi:hypothetical protein